MVIESSTKPRKLVAISEIKEAALSKVEKKIADYWELGANERVTYKANLKSFDETYIIKPRLFRGVENINIKPSKQLFNKTYNIPIGFSPSAIHKFAHKDAELATGRAAKSKNWPMALSLYSSTPMEEVKKVAGDSLIFQQMNPTKNKDVMIKAIKKAEACGFKAILCTIDTPHLGRRYQEERGEFNTHGIALPNFPTHVGDTTDYHEDPSATWDIIKWIKSLTKLQVWAKGVLTAEDAEAAVEAGVDGIWVSNHGGRQFDCTYTTLEALPEIVEAVNGRIPVHIDGGFRKGSDVFMALALGADFVWLGRPVLYGLAYDGQKGLELVQQILEDEFRIVMAFTGITKTSQINKSFLMRKIPKYSRL